MFLKAQNPISNVCVLNMEARRLRVSSTGTLSTLPISFEPRSLIGFEVTNLARMAGQYVPGLQLSLPTQGEAYVSPHLTFFHGL